MLLALETSLPLNGFKPFIVILILLIIAAVLGKK
jgi:hypothetical protein